MQKDGEAVYNFHKWKDKFMYQVKKDSMNKATIIEKDLIKHNIGIIFPIIVIM